MRIWLANMVLVTILKSAMNYLRKNRSVFFSSPLLVKPMWTMAKWRRPRTRDGRLAVFIVLPTGAIDTDGGIKTEFIASEQLQLSIS